MIKLKPLLHEYSIPYSIGFKKQPDFKHGLVKEFFKFFYMQGDQPVGQFKDMADSVHDRGYELDDLLGQVGNEAQEIHDYLKPPNKKDPEYDLNDMTQKGAAEVVYKYMDQANKLAKKIEASVERGGAAESSKVAKGLKGLIGTLKRAKNIFTSSLGSVKHKRIGFRFGD